MVWLKMGVLEEGQEYTMVGTDSAPDRMRILAQEPGASAFILP